MVNQSSLNELALFAGAGGGILGGQLLGWRTVCAVELEPYPASVLCARQNDGLLPPFPIWDDVQTFDGKPWRGIVDVISGGFPCQDISAAGKGAGIDGERSGMWKHMARIICEVRPKFAFVENSPMLTSRGLGVVLGDLASMGFDARWGVLGAADIGANHQRDRIWIVAKWRGQLPHAQHEKIRRWEQQQEGVKKSHVPNTSNNRCGKWANEYKHWEQNATPNAGTYGEEKSLADTDSAQRQRNKCAFGSHTKHTNIGSSGWWETEPNVGRVADGVASRVDRLKAIGNGQVPLCAAAAWKILSENL
jgi:DNA (cytosine-5)-methyltransferase 1